ncbi:MAG: hypothetical protein JWO60_2719 [Frankiales bacterium]|nr:hypothetical protein [Frankiales bacterium]
MTPGRVTAWQAFTAPPRWTAEQGVRPGWARALVPARDTPRTWVWVNLLLVVPTAVQLAFSPAGDTEVDRWTAVVAAAVLLVLTVRRGALALTRG